MCLCLRVFLVGWISVCVWVWVIGCVFFVCVSVIYLSILIIIDIFSDGKVCIVQCERLELLELFSSELWSALEILHTTNLLQFLQRNNLHTL